LVKQLLPMADTLVTAPKQRCPYHLQRLDFGGGVSFPQVTQVLCDVSINVCCQLRLAAAAAACAAAAGLSECAWDAKPEASYRPGPGKAAACCEASE
jgi:hypothetical protein